MVQLIRNIGDQKRGGRLADRGELRGFGMWRLSRGSRVPGIIGKTQIIVLIHSVTDLPWITANALLLDARRAAIHVLGKVTILGFPPALNLFRST